MTRFDASIPNAPQGQTLYEQVVNRGGQTPQAYLCCAASWDGNMRIYCVHCPSKFLGALDGATTPWDDRSFGFLGEVMHGHISVTFFPENAFEPVTTWAKTADYITQHLDVLQQDPAFPPDLPDADDPDISEVTTHRFMFLPHVYILLVLSAHGHTVKQLWEVLYPALLQRNDVVSCAPLIQWMRATSSGTTLADPMRIGPPATAIPLQIPPADEALLLHCHEVLNKALPHLAAPPASPENALSQMATALIVQTNDSRIARDQKIVQDAAPKLPSDRFTVTLPVLMEYLQVGNEADLPQIWHNWPSCAKRLEAQVLRDTLDAFARSPDAFSSALPVVTWMTS
jgi:hypothetical protein